MVAVKNSDEKMAKLDFCRSGTTPLAISELR